MSFTYGMTKRIGKLIGFFLKQLWTCCYTVPEEGANWKY